MTPSAGHSEATPTDELVIERVFDAPRALVFKMWSDPEHFQRWAAPAGFEVTHLEMEFRVGGIYRVCLHSPDAGDVWIKGYYQEIAEPESFSLTTGWENDDGNVDHETLLTVTLEDIGDRTKLTLRQGKFDSAEARDGSTGGWNEVLESLARYLVNENVSSGESR